LISLLISTIVLLIALATASISFKNSGGTAGGSESSEADDAPATMLAQAFTATIAASAMAKALTVVPESVRGFGSKHRGLLTRCGSTVIM